MSFLSVIYLIAALVVALSLNNVFVQHYLDADDADRLVSDFLMDAESAPLLGGARRLARPSV